MSNSRFLLGWSAKQFNFSFRSVSRAPRAAVGGDCKPAMPIEQFVVSEVEARSPSFGLNRGVGYDSRVLQGGQATQSGSKWEGTFPKFSSGQSPRASPIFGDSADSGVGSRRTSILEFFANATSGDGEGGGVGTYGPNGGKGTKSNSFKTSTVFFFFVAHCFFASTQGLFNDLLILKGFHAQFTLLAVHNALCGGVGFLVVTHIPEEAKKKQLKFSQIVKYCVPLAVCHSTKLYAQNKALEYVTPAFLSMTYGATPVLVAGACVAIGWERFGLRAGALISLAAFGVVLTAAGEMNESHAGDDGGFINFGLILAFTSVVAEVGRLVLLEQLLRRVQVTVGGLLVYTAPMEIFLLSLGAVVFESSYLINEVPQFDSSLWWLLLLNTAWALCTNVTTYCFVRVGSALLAACSAPFKDVGTIVLSDLFVEPRHESRLAVFGYSLACVASFAYCVEKLGEREESNDLNYGLSNGGSSGEESPDKTNSSRSSGTISGKENERAPLLEVRANAKENQIDAESFEMKQKQIKSRERGKRLRLWLILGAVFLAVFVNIFFLLVESPDEALEQAGRMESSREVENLVLEALEEKEVVGGYSAHRTENDVY